MEKGNKKKNSLPFMPEINRLIKRILNYMECPTEMNHFKIYYLYRGQDNLRLGIRCSAQKIDHFS